MTAALDTPTRAVPAVRALTIRDELERLAPDWRWSDLLGWPPDLFALTSAVLSDSGAYRFVVCPPPGARWPPSTTGDAAWKDQIARIADEWAGDAASPPAEAAALADVVARSEDVEIGALESPEHWQLVVALLSLHAIADSACEGAGMREDTPLHRSAAARLAASGTLARLDTGRARVLPKLRPPESGITLRSLSHHLAFDRSEVESRWYFAPRPRTHENATPGRLTLLLVPFPHEVRASDFRAVNGPLQMDDTRYGFYEYEPHEPLDLDDVVELVASAQRHVGAVDAVVLPESALDAPAIDEFQSRLAAAGVPFLIAGAREAPAPDAPFGFNFAHFGGGEWQAPRQHKHHRWYLDAEQVQQYHLGSALDPMRAWWEAIGIQRRSITFVSISDWLTVCPLVCEDLARPDPVTDVIRAVAPTLVVGLLLDGPQLASRWPARYAGVLADDPGCSVLTLTALGMTQRSQPAGFGSSRAVALWKDPRRGLHEIVLAPGARAVALTAHARPAQLISADGRVGKHVPELVLSGLEQIR